MQNEALQKKIADLAEKKRKKDEFMTEVAAIRLQLEMRDIVNERERKLAEEKRILEERKRLQREQEEFEAREIDRKTKNYFDLTPAFKKLLTQNTPYYFGEAQTSPGGAWLPHGPGEFYYADELQQKGIYVKGRICGNGLFIFDDGSKWAGKFVRGDMDGPGILTLSDGNEKAVVMRKNQIIAFQDGMTSYACSSIVHLNSCNISAFFFE